MRQFFKVAVFVCLAGAASGAAFFQQVGSGMVGFWRLEETASPSRDSSGNGHDSQAWSAGLTSLPGPANTAAALGTNSAACLGFDGAAGVVTIPSAADLNITGDITIALWIYKNSEAGDWVRLVGKGASAVRTFGVWEESGAGTRILFQMYNGTGGSVLDVFSTGTIPLNSWTHVACRLSGNAATVFINGVAGGTGTRNGTPGTSADPVTLGYAGFHTYWPGRMDDIRIYSRALADGEITALSGGGQGPAAPTNLTATAASASVSLNWTSSGAVVYNVKRGTVSGGPYTTIMSNVAGTSFVDNTVTPGTLYYYVVSGVTYGEGPNSNEASALPGLVSVLPLTGLFTNESGLSTTAQIRLNQALPSGQTATLTVTSSNAAEGVVSAMGFGPLASIVFSITGPQPVGTQIPLTITGVNDDFADGDQPYTVRVATSGFYGAVTIPDLQCTNRDNDTPGITINRTNGIVTTESGGMDSFQVVLNSQPTSDVTLNLRSLNLQEGTVSPTTLVFLKAPGVSYTPGGVGSWDKPHVVTVTGVDDTALDFTVAYTIETDPLSTSDPTYSGMAVPDVSCNNLDDEVPPELPKVWGGCGLLGPELLLLPGLILLHRRRSRARRPRGGLLPLDPPGAIRIILGSHAPPSHRRKLENERAPQGRPRSRRRPPQGTGR
ncbi:MAG TPA: LamG-like jellyroll fold domain-containing protein [Planctomycetota bacterium]|nr:LamG-like jellyroll fold domain-containing protein [Planctomycetota bacterium]